MPRSNSRRLLYERVKETIDGESRGERRACDCTPYRVVCPGATLSLGGGFSVRTRDSLAESLISNLRPEARRLNSLVATVRGSKDERPVVGSPHTTLPRVRQ